MQIEVLVIAIGMAMAIVATVFSYYVIKPYIVVRIYTPKWLLLVLPLCIFTMGFWAMLFVQTFI